MDDNVLDIQFQTATGCNKTLAARASSLSLISQGSSNVTVIGSIATGAPLLELFSDTVLDSALSTVDISGIDELQISVDTGDPIWGRIY